MQFVQANVIVYLSFICFAVANSYPSPWADIQLRDNEYIGKQPSIFGRTQEHDYLPKARDLASQVYTRAILGDAVTSLGIMNKILVKRTVDPKSVKHDIQGLHNEAEGWDEETQDQKNIIKHGKGIDVSLLKDHAHGSASDEYIIPEEKSRKQENDEKYAELYKKGQVDLAESLKRAHKTYSKAWGRNHALLKAYDRENKKTKSQLLSGPILFPFPRMGSLSGQTALPRRPKSN